MVVMPFGMVNSGATFQWVMDRTLGHIKGVESYVDDILVYSDTFEQHLKRLRQVFSHLAAASIQLKEVKCRFAYHQCEFLGHHISQEGRGPTDDYLNKISSFPRSNTVQELQRFLGVINYYRCYLPRMSEIAAPLNKLTKKGMKWLWDDECEQAYLNLRRKLINEPISISFPDWNELFYVETEASALGVAAVLSQLDTGSVKLRPVCYYYSSLNTSQRNYSAGQLEAWALVAAVRKWSVYLKGAREIIFLTHHCPLQ